MASNKDKTTKSKENGPIVKVYLLAYNLLQVVGWSYILFKLVNFHLGGEEKGKTLWEVSELAVNIFQNAAVLEIFHASTGIVKSNPVVTTFQVLSRVMLVCGVLLATPSTYAQASVGLPLALLAWSVTEIIRYGYYFSNLIGLIPYFLTWLRYTTFIVLYPIGITGELLCLYAATKYATAHPNAWSYVLPNSWNLTFSYHYFLIFVMSLYIPLFPQLYLHMFSQRRKNVGTSQSKSEKVH